MTYPGGKNGAGIYQRIINHMPPHRVYIEPFLGSGAVMRHKRPAERNIGIDRCPEALSLCLDKAGKMASDITLLEGDALEHLPALKTLVIDGVFMDQPDTLIYADPPYMMETRSGRELYDFEMDDQAHEALVTMLADARCIVMISGYRSALYDDVLGHFTRLDYPAMTRRGQVTESLWMNFAAFITRYDGPKTLFYLDPPYWGCEDDYGKALFSRCQFEAMATQIRTMQGRCLMSINDVPEIRAAFDSLHIVPVATTYTSGGKGADRSSGSAMELIVSNFVFEGVFKG